MAELTAKQRHRLEVERRAGRRPTCALASPARGECSGVLQADHPVELGWLKEWLARRTYRRDPVPCVRCRGLGAVGAVLVSCPDCNGSGNATLEAVAADARNGWLVCERHHGLKTAGLLLPPITRDELPDELDAFLIDYRCAHLLDDRAAFALA